MILMYFNKLKLLRENKGLTQENISKILNIKRATYGFWENGRIMIPLDKADFLSVYYGVSLSYLLGIDSKIIFNQKVKAMNYDILLKNLKELKKSKKYSYEKIADYIDCNKSTCYRYFKGVFIIPIDRLVLLSDLFEINLDKLCGKE